MSMIIFTANRTGELFLKALKQAGIKADVVTYNTGFQRTGLAADFSAYKKDFNITFISENSYERCRDIDGIIGGRTVFAVDWTKDFFNGYEGRVVCAHPSLLPLYRGYSAVTEQFERGVALGGATFYIRNDRIDGGDIISARKIPIAFEMYPEDYLDVYTAACADFYKELSAKDIDQYELTQQDDREAFYLQRKRSRDALIDFNRDAFSLYNHIRAYSKPYFGAYFMSGGRRITVWRAHTEKWQGDYGEPGTILDMSINGTEIACGSGTIVLTETEGMIWDEVMTGMNLHSLPEHPSLSF